MAPLPQKIELCRKLLMQAPPSELSEVITDLQAIVADDALFSAHIVALCREYNETYGTIIEAGDEKLVLSPLARADAEGTCYVTPSGRIVTVDHVRRTAGAEDAEGQAPTFADAEVGSALQTALAAHAAQLFPNGAVQVYADGDGYAFTLSAARGDLPNYWSAAWRCQAHIDASFAVKGTISARGHFFEGGSVTSEVSDAVAFECGGAEDVAQKLTGVEQAFFGKLEQFYSELSERQFKSLRRTLPIFKHKIGDRWNQILTLTVM